MFMCGTLRCAQGSKKEKTVNGGAVESVATEVCGSPQTRSEHTAQRQDRRHSHKTGHN